MRLKQAITPRTRGIIVVHPNNPTGHFTKPEEIAQLNQICSANKMAIIADEVFLDFSLGVPQKSFVTNSGALTFTMSGISKISGLPQMKFAWLAVSGPEDSKKGSAGPVGDDRRHLSFFKCANPIGRASFIAAAQTVSAAVDGPRAGQSCGA